MAILTAVDDQLYFSNDTRMRQEYEEAVSKRFDVELLGQVHWYLQARITQHTDFSITLDQSRYAALICTRFLPTFPISTVTNEDRDKYHRPLPSEFVATREDLANDMFEVRALSDEFGFRYNSVVGMLIFLMNTFIYLHLSISKLAKFMVRPGRKHFEAVVHYARSAEF
jgi:hypothetical protein